MSRTLRLTPIGELSPLTRVEEVVAFNVGPSGSRLRGYRHKATRLQK